MARAKRTPVFKRKQIKGQPGIIAGAVARAAADLPLVARRFRDASAGWVNRTYRLRRERAEVLAAVATVLIESMNLATGYAWTTVKETASRCGVRTRSRAGNFSNSRVSRAFKQLREQGYIEFTNPTFNPELHVCDSALIVVRDELLAFMGVRLDKLAAARETALRRAIRQRQTAAYANHHLGPLPADPIEAVLTLRAEQWAKYTKTVAARARQKLMSLRHAHARQLKSQRSGLLPYIQQMANALKPKNWRIIEQRKLAAAQSGQLFPEWDDPGGGFVH